MTLDLLEKFGITYRDSDHRYSRFGVKLDSVSSVLPYFQNEFLAAHPERIEKAGVRGSGVARFIEAVEGDPLVGKPGGMVKLPSLSGLTVHSVQLTPEYHYLRFKQENGFRALVSPTGDISSELFVYHDILDYVGRLDLVGTCHQLPGAGLIEVKATAIIPKTVGPQSAAYFEAFNRCAKLYGFPKLKWRASLHLTAKGYRFHPLTDPLDFPRFCSVLTTCRWARELGLELQWVETNRQASPTGDTPQPESVFA